MKNFKFKWLLLSIILSIASINTAWAWTSRQAKSTISHVYVSGSMNSWSTNSSEWELTKVDQNHWYGDFLIMGQSSNYEFKLYLDCSNNTYDGHYSGQYDYKRDYTGGEMSLYSTDKGNSKIVPVTSSTSTYIGIRVEFYAEYGSDDHGYLRVTQYQYGTSLFSSGSTLYLDADGITTDARFAAVFCKAETQTWVDMSQVGSTNFYSLTLSADYPMVIFCRMNGSQADNTWDNRWNQSADLTPNSSNNCYDYTSYGDGNRFNGTWRTVYTVTAAVNNASYGSASSNKPLLYNSETATITASPNTGYKVTNWAKSGTGASISPSGASNSTTTTLTMGTANATVTATLGAKTYTAENNINANGGSSNGKYTATFDATTIAINTTPSYSDHTVDGYYGETEKTTYIADASGNLQASKSVSGNQVTDANRKWKRDASITLYAKWKCNAPAVSCTDNVVTITVPTGSTVYYTTDGSTTPTSSSTAYDPSNKPTIAANTTIKAIAIQAGCTNSNVTTQAVTYTPVYTVTHALSNASKTSGETSVLQNKVYTAAYEDVTGYDLPDAVTVTIGGVEKTETTDYTWDAGTLTILENKITGNVVITVTGVAKEYTTSNNIKHSDNTTAGTYKVNYDATSIVFTTEPTKRGYDIEGFYKTNTDGVLSDKIANANRSLVSTTTTYTTGGQWKYTSAPTLYVDWTAQEYSITYKDKDNADFSGVHEDGYPTSHTYGSATALGSPTKKGYVFEGWYTASDCASGKVTSLGATDFTANITLYAKWTAAATYASTCWDGETYKCGDGTEFNTPKSATSATWNGATWGKSATPTIATQVVIPADMEMTIPNGVTAKAKEVVLSDGAKLNIEKGGALIVASTIDKEGSSTSSSDLTLYAGDNTYGNAALIWGEAGTTPGAATVDFYSKSHGQAGSTASVNQYIGVPTATSAYSYGDAWVCKIAYEENIAYWTLMDGSEIMSPWVGYDLILNTTNTGGLCTLSGTLEDNSDKDLSLHYYSSKKTENLLANSWPAPIKISAFLTTDFTNAEPTIYIFNSTSPAAQVKDETMHMGSYTAFTAGTATEVIPSMQSFSVCATSLSASVKLNYKRLVYNPAVDGFSNSPNYAPRREERKEMNSLKVNVHDAEGWGDELKAFENADFSAEFEPGWDGHRLDGSSKAPHLYGLADDGSELAVSCLPTFDNMPIGFKASAKAKTYIMSFKYDGEDELVLRDTKTNIETPIDEESTYEFVSESTDDDLRFVVVKKAPQIATGVENTTSNEETKVQKILHNGSLYIIRDGRIYNAEGALVK